MLVVGAVALGPNDHIITDGKLDQAKPTIELLQSEASYVFIV